MAYARKKLPVQLGSGELRSRSYQGHVDYEITGEPTTLRLGPNRLRGCFTATPEIAEQAFRDGDGVLTLESGAPYRITFIGYTAGSNTAYFEMRI